MKRLMGMLRAVFPDLQYDIAHVIAEGDQVVQRTIGTAP